MQCLSKFLDLFPTTRENAPKFDMKIQNTSNSQNKTERIQEASYFLILNDIVEKHRDEDLLLFAQGTATSMPKQYNRNPRNKYTLI